MTVLVASLIAAGWLACAVVFLHFEHRWGWDLTGDEPVLVGLYALMSPALVLGGFMAGLIWLVVWLHDLVTGP